MISYKYVFSFFLAILLVMISIAQSGRASESLELLSDSLIKREVSSFSTTKTTSRNSSIPLKNQMIEIPLQHCSDSEVHFSLSKFNSSISTFIHLYFKQPPAGRIIDSIFVVTHSHFWVKIPQSAYEGIYQNLSCDVSGGRGKKERVVSPNYKAYYSANKRRMYIYMIGGSEGNKYEVTWVFVDDKYFTRVLDMLQ